jgi:hypothetical protein
VVGVVVAGLLALGFGLGAHKYVASHWLAREIRTAGDADAEVRAFCAANRWVQRGFAPTYSVQAFAADDHEIRPWQDGDYERVATVTLRWRGGAEVTRTLLTTRPLGCIFGE